THMRSKMSLTARCIASRNYLEEYAESFAKAREARLEPVEEQLLAGPVAGAVVAHPMSGHGVDDAALARLGAAEVIGLDYSPAAVTSARRRAEELGLPCRYLTAELPDSGLDTASVDVVYTGKG